MVSASNDFEVEMIEHEHVLERNPSAYANLPSGVTATPIGLLPTGMAEPTTVFALVSMTETLFEEKLGT